MTPSDHNAVAAMAGSFLLIFVFTIIGVAFAILINWRIASKAGFSGPLSLLMLIPFVNFIILILFAFTEWPIERALRTATGVGPAPGPVPYVPPGGGGYAPSSATYLPPAGTQSSPPDPWQQPPLPPAP